MREELIKLLDKAYAPYSKFKVAAIIETADGKYIPGVNVENASYGAAICAERNAVTTAVAMGYRKGDFKKIYIMVSGDKLSMPCFICRQVIVEFFDKDSEIVLISKNGEEERHTVSELCPYPFDETDL
ncbi:MAG: cytidine deaminase [Erysipelotrichaceae bacterium]|nr:cytidine deaminase [Erysipelotrichaceae bacterium]MDY3934767.1 cytidine deaminase [Bacilli bacterium]